MVTYRYTLDMLTPHSVSVKKQTFATINGEEYEIGQPHRKAYMNSVSGRAEVVSELPEPQQNAIFAVWGDTPTVVEGAE